MFKELEDSALSVLQYSFELLNILELMEMIKF